MTFNDKCYQLLSQIPQGKVSTYKEIASALNTKAYQAVGNAMAKNPNLISVPCHRVIRSDLSIGGFAGQTRGAEITRKQILLKQEGILFDNEKLCDVDQIYYY